MNIFGLSFNVDDITSVQDAIWNTDSFLPNQPARALPISTGLTVLSDLGQRMAVTLADGKPGLLAQNALRQAVEADLKPAHFLATMMLLQNFKSETDPAKKKATAQFISDVAFWAQWLIRGFLFEGKLHWEVYCADVIPAPLSKIAFAANAALGRHQIEFVYDDYTLKAAIMPTDAELEALDYDSSSELLNGIARIKTLVGFNDVAGGSPEHNFRHNHSLMEFQMKAAFQGTKEVLEGDVNGWDKIVEAARRANRVFRTMLATTTPESYPKIRLPIKGVRGACGSVYHPHGVFYEGCGSDVYKRVEDGLERRGVYVDDEWGQTGANSSMFKFFDVLIGVSQLRGAFNADPIMISRMAQVFDKQLDSGELGTNPIDSMQRAFDLFTRPPKHMRILVDTDVQLQASGVLTSADPQVLLQRLRLAYWVAEHRVTHGKYIVKAIYKTESVGGQSKAQGTGGSTPPFLKLFLDQTLAPGRNLIIKLLMQPEVLTVEQKQEVAHLVGKFEEFETRMDKVRDLGLKLEHDEKVSNVW